MIRAAAEKPGEVRVAHRIEKQEKIGVALLRLAHDDLMAARKDITGPGPREQRIHRVRQRLKRVRTVLTVIEPGLGARAQTARQALTGIARSLAGARDADVAAASARGLAASAPQADALGFERVVAELDREAARAHRERTPITEINRRLGLLAGEVAALEAESFDGRKLLEDALKRAYRQGREAMKRAHASLATPDLHSWRKKVKQLWHLLRLARKRLRDKGDKASQRLERLGDLLGLDHDHALLAEKLALSPTADLSLMSQLALISDRRREIQAEAFELGGRLYDGTTVAFAKSLKLK